MKHRIITMCGSTRFIEEMAVVAWMLERDEKVITIGLHLLPWWYTEIKSHLAEHEGCAAEMDALHMEKISISDAIFVIDADDDGSPYIGESTSKEIAFAERLGLPVRRLSTETDIRIKVYQRMLRSVQAEKKRREGEGE